MAEKTAIEWCDSTFNPWIGCTKVGPGCDNCYAEVSTPARTMSINWGTHASRWRTSASTWSNPVKWEREHEAFQAQHGRRRRVFCASLADVFDNVVDPTWRAELFRLIEATPHLDWLLLTKRIGNAASMLFEARGGHLPLLPNLWLGATFVNQAEYDRDIGKLLAVPACVRFLSLEPLLGPIDLGLMRGHETGWRAVGIDWVIVGGESGPKARPMHPDWARSLRDQCAAAGVAFHFKQWGEWKPISEMSEAETNALYYSRRIAKPHEDQANIDDLHGRACRVETDGIGFGGARGVDAFWVVEGKGGMQMFKVGKKAAGRQLDGVEHNGFPHA